ncbi:MAG: hypothetical protein GKR88_02930 [Flavobacteriaceae bacterium]|nr:MAG: hypothetical protein GKR88_02930 [Flavobacteriaceae bacterium]
METHLKVAGTLLVILALIHFIFPKYFKWEKEFNSLSLINKQMTYVHTFFIAFIVFLMGLLCLTSSKDIIGTALGNRIALGLGVFWLLRLGIQFFGYSSELWRGKTFETLILVHDKKYN